MEDIKMETTFFKKGTAVTENSKEVEEIIELIFMQKSFFFGWCWPFCLFGPISLRSQLKLITAIDSLKKNEHASMFIVLNDMNLEKWQTAYVAHFVREKIQSDHKGRIYFSNRRGIGFEEALVELISKSSEGGRGLVVIKVGGNNPMKRLIQENIKREIDGTQKRCQFPVVRFC